MGLNEVMDKLGMDKETVLRRFGNNEGKRFITNRIVKL